MRPFSQLVIVGVVSISLVSFAAEKPAARSLDDLPAAARQQFEELQAKYWSLAQQIQAEWEEAYRKDPLLRQAKAGRGELDEKIAAAREKMKGDVDAFVASGRGDAAQFKYWQTHYRIAVCKKELAADESHLPYRDWQVKMMFDHRGSARVKSMLESIGRQPDALTLEQMPEVMKTLLDREAKQSQAYLDAIEPNVQPSDEAKQHVLELTRYHGLDGLYAYYELSKTPPQFKQLDEQLLDVVNQMTGVWPDWRDAMFAQGDRQP
jgi:hypothetical protein